MPSYKLSFTAASLVIIESINVADVFLKCKNWSLTREIVIENNILQSRTISRSKRLVREIITRLSNLTEEQLTLLIEGNLEEQKQLLWFAVCKTYPFIAEFATEVLHQKFLLMEKQVSHSDFHAFFLKKLDLHPELEKTTESTQQKLQSTLFLMMRQADLINTKFQIIRVLPSTRLAHTLSPDAEIAYRFYPAFPEEFKRLL